LFTTPTTSSQPSEEYEESDLSDDDDYLLPKADADGKKLHLHQTPVPTTKQKITELFSNSDKVSNNTTSLNRFFKK